MKNVLEICNQLGIGGTEKALQIFCKYLNKENYKVFSCGIFRGGEREGFIKNNVESLLIADGDIGRIKTFVLENRIDIVHWHSISQNPGLEFEKSIELLKFFNENKIRVIETSPFSLYNKKIDDLLDVKLFVSQINLLKYFWKFGSLISDKSKYYYLYNPLDIEELSKYKLNTEEKKKLRNKYGIGINDFVIGKVGRASLWKWDDSIIDVIKLLKESIPDLKVVIRAIPEQKRIKIQKLGIEKYFILLNETVDEREICETYQLMDVMLHTSRIGECNSVAINEGLYFGIPIVTKNTDFMQFTVFGRDNGQIELIEDNINGFVENEIVDIARCVISLSANKKNRNEISLNNYSKSLELLDATKITTKLECIFEGNFSKELIWDIEMYKNKVKKDKLIRLFFENFKAIYDKFILKA